MPQAPDELKDFQREYAAFLREPSSKDRPKDIPSRQSLVYEELLFNNIKGFIDNCFPVAKSLFSGDQWQNLARQFYSEWPSHTPYFHKIPKQFVDYLNSESTELPASMPWLAELCHYEWMELHVDTLNVALPQERPILNLNNKLTINPTLQLLQYVWPVHTISQSHQPEKPEHTFILVFRNTNDRVKFININAVTALLIDVAQQTDSINEAMKFVAEKIGKAADEKFTSFGLDILQSLAGQEAILMHID